MSTAAQISQGEFSPSAFLVQTFRGGVEVIDDLAGEWQDLCFAASNDQPFFRPEWIRAYVRAFAPEANLVLITVRLDNRLCLVLPLMEEKGSFSKIPVRKLCSSVNNWGGRLDTVRKPGPEGDAAILAAFHHLQQLAGWDLLQFQYVLEGSALGQLVAAAQDHGFHVIRQTDRPSPYLPIPVDPNLLERLPINARLRRELRQVRRQLSEQNVASNFYRVDVADRNELERFYRLEASGWKGHDGSAILNLGLRDFFDELAESATRFGYFSLYMLELNGELVAAHFGFTHKDCYYSVVVAYNENFKQFSPGHLIIGEILRDCARRGIRVYDLTGQDQEWKLKWTNQAYPVSHYYIFKGVLGKLAYAVKSKLRPAVGRLAPGAKNVA